MNKLILVLAISAALGACSKSETPAASSSSAPASAPASQPAATAPAAPAAPSTAMTSAGSDLPKECNEYFDRVAACVAKQDGTAAEAMKANLAQAKAQWSAIPGGRAAVAAACKSANEAFASQAALMKC